MSQATDTSPVTESGPTALLTMLDRVADVDEACLHGPCDAVPGDEQCAELGLVWQHHGVVHLLAAHVGQYAGRQARRQAVRG